MILLEFLMLLFVLLCMYLVLFHLSYMHHLLILFTHSLRRASADLRSAFSEPEHGDEVLRNAELTVHTLLTAGCRVFMTAASL